MATRASSGGGLTIHSQLLHYVHSFKAGKLLIICKNTILQAFLGTLFEIYNPHFPFRVNFLPKLGWFVYMILSCQIWKPMHILTSKFCAINSDIVIWTEPFAPGLRPGPSTNMFQMDYIVLWVKKMRSAMSFLHQLTYISAHQPSSTKGVVTVTVGYFLRCGCRSGMQQLNTPEMKSVSFHCTGWL